MQLSFNPVRYGLRWVEAPIGGGKTMPWYEWDEPAARKAAQAARRAEAKRLRAEGYRVKCWSLRNQLTRLGGIGSGHPDVSFWTTVYMLDYYEA